MCGCHETSTGGSLVYKLCYLNDSVTVTREGDTGMESVMDKQVECEG